MQVSYNLFCCSKDSSADRLWLFTRYMHSRQTMIIHKRFIERRKTLSLQKWQTILKRNCMLWRLQIIRMSFTNINEKQHVNMTILRQVYLTLFKVTAVKVRDNFGLHHKEGQGCQRVVLNRVFLSHDSSWLKYLSCMQAVLDSAHICLKWT